MLVCILDGWGVNVEDEYNAVFSADTPCTDALKAVPKRYRSVKAHGTAVGLPSDADMGNSEVGHNALGSGQVRGVEGGVQPAAAAGVSAQGIRVAAHQVHQHTTVAVHAVARLHARAHRAGLHGGIDAVLASCPAPGAHTTPR